MTSDSTPNTAKVLGEKDVPPAVSRHAALTINSMPPPKDSDPQQRHLIPSFRARPGHKQVSFGGYSPSLKAFGDPRRPDGVA